MPIIIVSFGVLFVRGLHKKGVGTVGIIPSVACNFALI